MEGRKKMAEIKIVKKYPNIRDEDVTEIFQEGYLKGFENGRKKAIPIEWIENYVRSKFCLADWYGVFIGRINMMLDDWEWENEESSNRD